MLGLGLLTDNLDVKLFDFDFIFFLDIDQEPISKTMKTSKLSSKIQPTGGEISLVLRSLIHDLKL